MAGGAGHAEREYGRGLVYVQKNVVFFIERQHQQGLLTSPLGKALHSPPLKAS